MKDSARFYNENSSENFDQSEHLYRLHRVSATRRNNGCFATGDFLLVHRLIKVFSSQVILAGLRSAIGRAPDS